MANKVVKSEANKELKPAIVKKEIKSVASKIPVPASSSSEEESSSSDPSSPEKSSESSDESSSESESEEEGALPITSASPFDSFMA